MSSELKTKFDERMWFDCCWNQADESEVKNQVFVLVSETANVEIVFY